LGDFLDAFKSGQKIKQDKIEQAQKQATAQSQKLQQAIQDARNWVTNVLVPVVADVSADIAGAGSSGMVDNSNLPKVSHQITLAMNGKKPVTLAFIVDENGAVNFYQDGSQGNTMGTVVTVNQVQVRQVFINVLGAMGKA
jgi:hypothetical protein